MDDATIRKLGGCAGIAAVAVYVLCTLAAAFSYPAPYSPFGNWISDLGSFTKNPSGALFYDAGAVAAGLLLMLFFVGMATWYARIGKGRGIFAVAMIFGLLAAIGMLMHGVFHEGTALHLAWAALCFGSLFVMLALADYALLQCPQFTRLIGYYGYAAALIGLVYFAMFVAMDEPPRIMEWLAAYAGLLWVWLASFDLLANEGQQHPSGA